MVTFLSIYIDNQKRISVSEQDKSYKVEGAYK